jgi:hypothetical protein
VSPRASSALNPPTHRNIPLLLWAAHDIHTGPDAPAAHHTARQTVIGLVGVVVGWEMAGWWG